MTGAVLDDALDDLDGAPARLVPADAVRLLDGYPGRWWIAGGWALEAFAGTGRAHHDLDIGAARPPLDRRPRLTWSEPG